MTDRELIEGCMRNDRLCQQALFKRFAAKMKSICMRYINNKDDVNDVVQEGFIKVFKSLDKFNYQGSFEGWVRRAMVNTALTKLDRHSYEEEVELVPEIHESYDYTDIIGNISAKELRAEIAKLPEGYRIVFNMFVIEGYSHKEIGETLKIAEMTSRSQLSKARKMLQDRLKKNEIIIEHEH